MCLNIKRGTRSLCRLSSCSCAGLVQASEGLCGPGHLRLFTLAEAARAAGRILQDSGIRHQKVPIEDV